MVSSFSRNRGAAAAGHEQRRRPLIPKEETTVLRTGVMGRSGGKARRVLATGLLAAGVMTAATVSTAVVGDRHGRCQQRARNRASGDLAGSHDRSDQRRRRQQLHRHSRTGGAGRQGRRCLRERVRRRARGPQDRPLHLREPVDPGRRPDLRQRHGPARRRRRGRTLHRAGSDRSADHRRCRHPLHHDQRSVHGRAHLARRLRHRGRLPGLPGCRGAERQAARLHEGRLPGGQRAGRHPGRAGARRHRLQGGGRRLHRDPGQLGHGGHEPAAAVGRLRAARKRWAWSAT